MYTNNLLKYVNEQSGNMISKSVIDPIVQVSTIQGGRQTLPASQSRVNQIALCTATYTPSSAYSNMLSSGSQVDFNISLSTVLSKAYDIAIHFTVQNNTGGNVVLYPVPCWFNRVEIRFNSQVVQQFYTTDLYNYLWIFIDSQWRLLSDLFALDDRFLPSFDNLANGDSQEYILLLPQNIFKETNMFCPALNVEFVLRLYMNTSNNIVFSGTAPQISSMYTEFITNHQSIDDTTMLFNQYRSGNFQLRYYWLVNQTQTMQSMQANTRYEFLMSSFTGVFDYLQFLAQPANAVGLQLLDSRRIQAFDVLDQNGLSYFNNNSLQSDTESRIWDTMVVNPWQRFDEVKNVYKYPFSATARADLLGGKLGGFMCLDGRSRFVLETGDAATPKIITWTLHPGVATAGQFRISYTGFGQTSYTPWMAFNTSAANIALAIEAIPQFIQYGQLVTVSAALSASAAITVTYSAAQQLAFDEFDTNASLEIESQLSAAGPVSLYVDSTISQAPVDGWFVGDYNIILMGSQVKYLSVLPTGGVKITES